MALFKSFPLLFMVLMAQAAPVEYKIDPSHATLIFRASHLGFSTVIGGIPGAEGVIKFDDSQPSN